MPTGNSGRKHWAHVVRHLLLDCFIAVAGILLAATIRFGELHAETIALYAPTIAIAALSIAGVAYIAGLYSLHHTSNILFVRLVLVGSALGAGILAILAYGSIDFSSRIGRGVLLLAVPCVGTPLVIHHLYLLRLSQRIRERIASIVQCPLHEVESEMFGNVPQKHTEFIGMIGVGGYRPENEDQLLGDLSQVNDLVRNKQIDCLLCPPEILDDPEAAKTIRELRYSGVGVLTLADVCEEYFQAMPLDLVSPGWLLASSGQPRLFYVRKLKRAFDILLGSLVLLALLPVLLLGIIAVAVTSKGPVFYRQERAGRFGSTIHLRKLRTMTVDAEKGGAQWSKPGDSRITPVGRILRKFRIDEIPQLWNVIRGQMSFVGPRPERHEMIEQLAEDIPLFSERVMVQPGLTGWAQVNYPYGSSIDDARRKLEYDLYYMKHMSIFLDFFILLDTVRIVVLGGAPQAPGKKLGVFNEAIRTKMPRETRSDYSSMLRGSHRPETAVGRTG